MFHWFGVVQNTRGDALPGWQVGLTTVAGEPVSIFADENSTAIVTVSGVANRAVADENGNYDFFVPNGNYTLDFYNAAGLYQRSQRFVAMFGAQNPATVRTITGTTHTLEAVDENAVLRFTNGSAITLTFPSDANASIPVGAAGEIHQKGAGVITAVAGSGATLEASGGLVSSGGQFAVLGWRKDAANTFVLVGERA